MNLRFVVLILAAGLLLGGRHRTLLIPPADGAGAVSLARVGEDGAYTPVVAATPGACYRVGQGAAPEYRLCRTMVPLDPALCSGPPAPGPVAPCSETVDVRGQ